MSINFYKRDDYIYESFLNNNPYLDEDEIDYWFQATHYDIFVKFKNGSKLLYQMEDDYTRPLPYKSEILSDDEFKKEYSARLRRFMRLRCVNQDELANIVGISQASISRYVNGEAMPNGNMLYKIAKVLKLPIDDFYYREH